MLNNNQATQIDSRLIPNAVSATQEFESNGGLLIHFNAFGEDPLQANATLVAQRESEFIMFIEIFKIFSYRSDWGPFYSMKEYYVSQHLSAN